MIPPLRNLLLSATISTPTLIFMLGFVVILLILSAFFAASEMAFSTVNQIRMRKLADDNVRGARRALQIIENYDRTISTILVGNNLVNIASTTICAYLFSLVFINPTLANVLNTVIMTIIILIFGEITPKSWAKLNPETIALRFAKPMYFTLKIMYPIVFPFILIQNLFLKRAKNKNNASPIVAEDELESIIDTMEEEGILKSDDADLFMGVLEINEKTVYDVMTPRVDVVAINVDDTPEKINQTFLESGYSRVPVYEKDKDSMIGIVNYKDYFKAHLANKDTSVKKMIKTTIYVAENMKVKELIRRMQQEKKHLAIVLDEHGGTSGIVTMEDALEEMVGEIYDEHDKHEEQISIIKTGDNTYEIDAEVDIDDLFEELEIEHLPDTDYNSIGGYLYELAENLPMQDQVIETIVYDEQLNDQGEYQTKRVKLTFTITKLEKTRIRKLLLKTETLPDN